MPSKINKGISRHCIIKVNEMMSEMMSNPTFNGEELSESISGNNPPTVPIQVHKTSSVSLNKPALYPVTAKIPLTEKAPPKCVLKFAIICYIVDINKLREVDCLLYIDCTRV